jgi:hypothetical protein
LLLRSGVSSLPNKQDHGLVRRLYAACVILSGGAGARGRLILEPLEDLRQSPLGDGSRAFKRPAGFAGSAVLPPIPV